MKLHWSLWKLIDGCWELVTFYLNYDHEKLPLQILSPNQSSCSTFKFWVWARAWPVCHRNIWNKQSGWCEIAITLSFQYELSEIMVPWLMKTNRHMTINLMTELFNHPPPRHQHKYWTLYHNWSKTIWQHFCQKYNLFSSWWYEI